MKVFIKTYGCQMNERDSEVVAGLLACAGHVLARREAEAEAILVNTCSVRGKAEDKAIGKLRLLAARSRPGRVLGVMGCLVQRIGAGIFEKVPGLHLAVGTQAYTRLPDLLEDAGPGRPPILALEPGGPPMDRPFGHRPGKVSAFVNILFGCSRACSYCVVPRVRGPEWSRSVSSVLEEVRGLAAGGAREVVLLGQSVMAYGRRGGPPADLPESPLGLREPFPRLVEAVAAVPGIVRVRFTSGHPSGCTDDLARVMAAVPGVCPHLHLPLQSGSDRILALMNRGYTRADYVRAARRLRDAVPGLALSTDVIVGFPSETESDFEETRGLLDELGFDNAFIFQYSPRPGTRAADLPDDVPAADKLRRNHLLLEDQDRRSRAFGEALIGRDVEVLAEGPSRRDRARWAGRTPWNRLVIFAAAGPLAPGDLVRVRVERATPQTLNGRALPGRT
jgi:tRNA-2-methylthio-N6-dimethylallyladenosine synthase